MTSGPIIQTHKYGTRSRGLAVFPLMSELPRQASKQTITQSTSAEISTTLSTWNLPSPAVRKIAYLELLDIVRQFCL